MSCPTGNTHQVLGENGAEGVVQGNGGLTEFQTYQAQKRAAATKKGVVKIGSDIAERWATRVLPRGLHTMGQAGAEMYLTDYGRGIAAPKCVSLALKAELEGYPEMAAGFWAKAYQLETGKTPEPGGVRPAACQPAASPAPAQDAAGPAIDTLPAHLQPGRTIPMQPVDAPRDRLDYANDPAYWGQPKRDGKKLLVMGDVGETYYQARSLKLQPPPLVELEEAMRAAAVEFGPFVLEGELYYPDWRGGEHRTGSQAAKVNVAEGHGDVQPKARYAIFKALCLYGSDLTGATEAERVQAGEEIAAWLSDRYGDGLFEMMPTSRTTEEKLALIARQQAEGREGEIWVRQDCQYTPGKNAKSEAIVRTKYLAETDGVILGLSTTSAEGRPFGAIEIGRVNDDGSITSLGWVGTGFDAGQMADIARRHAENPGGVKVTIASQGFTEDGKLWHGRFVEFVNEK